jgi:hypothetical protein
MAESKLVTPESINKMAEAKHISLESDRTLPPVTSAKRCEFWVKYSQSVTPIVDAMTSNLYKLKLNFIEQWVQIEHTKYMIRELLVTKKAKTILKKTLDIKVSKILETLNSISTLTAECEIMNVDMYKIVKSMERCPSRWNDLYLFSMIKTVNRDMLPFPILRQEEMRNQRFIRHYKTERNKIYTKRINERKKFRPYIDQVIKGLIYSISERNVLISKVKLTKLVNDVKNPFTEIGKDSAAIALHNYIKQFPNTEQETTWDRWIKTLNITSKIYVPTTHQKETTFQNDVLIW